MSSKEQEIEAYINGQMSEAAFKAFELELENDPGLQLDVQTYREMKAIFEDGTTETMVPTAKNPTIDAYEAFLISAEGKVLVNSIKKSEGLYFKKKGNGLERIWFYSGAVAATLVIGVFGLLYWFGNKSTDSLYNEYKNDWEDLPSFAMRGEDTGLSNAENLFRDGQYQKALQLFEEHLPGEGHELYPLILTYKGIAEVELNKKQAAIKSFTRLAESQSLDASSGHWYLALIYLKEGNIEKARGELQMLAGERTNYKHHKAKALLEEIE